MTDVEAALAAAGFVAADEEAAELIAAGGGDADVLGSLLDRRLSGEPLAWITGRTRFAGLDVRVDAGVYVPRWQSTELATRAARRLPEDGAAIDLCTGTGAVAMALVHTRPGARVVATDTDPRAVANARANGVDAHLGDLFAPLGDDLRGRTDVVVAVVPYVPTPALRLLPRDTLTFEDAAHYDGGPDGTTLLRRVVRERAGLPASRRRAAARARRRAGRAAASRTGAAGLPLRRHLDRRRRRRAWPGGREPG